MMEMSGIAVRCIVLCLGVWHQAALGGHWKTDEEQGGRQLYAVMSWEYRFSRMRAFGYTPHSEQSD